MGLKRSEKKINIYDWICVVLSTLYNRIRDHMWAHGFFIAKLMEICTPINQYVQST